MGVWGSMFQAGGRTCRPEGEEESGLGCPRRITEATGVQLCGRPSWIRGEMGAEPAKLQGDGKDSEFILRWGCWRLLSPR